MTSHAGVTEAHRFAQTPTSITWRVNAERIVLLGWGRAILLQLAHPLVAAGVFDHSGFRGTPYAAASRLYHTVHAMLSLTFGDEVARQKTLDAIRAIHRRVNGVLPESTGCYPSGTRYSAEDPDLVLWVHATLIESVLLVYERLVAPLTTAERDEYCAEAFPVAVALAAREDEVPRTWAGPARLSRYACTHRTRSPWEHKDESWHGPCCRRLVDGWWHPATWINRMITIGLLPAHAARAVRDDVDARDTSAPSRGSLRPCASRDE